MKTLRGIDNLAARSKCHAFLLGQTGNRKSYYVGLIDVQLVGETLELSSLCCTDTKRHSLGFGHGFSLAEPLSCQRHATVELLAGDVTLVGVMVDSPKVADRRGPL